MSISLANGIVSAALGDVKDLSEVGAQVLTQAALDRGHEVVVDVRSGYSLLFRAEARVVWSTVVERRHDSRVSVYGIFFTALSPFSRKLIRRLSGLVPEGEGTGRGFTPTWGPDAELDSDLEALFPLSGSDDDVFDMLSDPVIERLLYDEHVLTGNSGREDRDRAEISGSLGYFNNTDVLQMLEAARATGVLHVEGEYTGQIHLQEGRICGCFSRNLDEDEAAFRLIVADRGRFRFIPSGVRSNLAASRTTTELLLEAQLRLDHQH